MNLVILSGRLTKDPEIRVTNSTTVSGDPLKVANFSLAVPRTRNNGADFIRCTAFWKDAESAEKYFHKGTKIAIRGHWQTGSYDGKNGKVYTNDCVIDGWEFAESKNDRDEQADEPEYMPVPLDEELPF